jgi:riboflavin kinase / FMN adenylyltransferase
MLHFKSLGEVPKEFSPSAITIGKFDALHLGHQHLLCCQLTEVAWRERELHFGCCDFRSSHPLQRSSAGQVPRSRLSVRRKRVAHTERFRKSTLW